MSAVSGRAFKGRRDSSNTVFIAVVLTTLISIPLTSFS